MKRRSLTRTLIVTVLLAEFSCAALFSGLSLLHEFHSRQHAVEVLLHGRADSVLGAIQDAEDRDDNVIVDPAELPVPREDLYEVQMSSGRIVGHSPGASASVFEALNADQSTGFFDFKANGRHYRAIRQAGLRVIDREEQRGGIRRPVTITYATPTHLWHSVFEAARFYVLASCALLLVTGLAITWFLRRSLMPLRQLAEGAGRVSITSWNFEVPQEALATTELEPIATSIQQLLFGLRAAFDRQRQFTGDAAHELKTSIALLKSRLQLVSMRNRTPEAYRENVEELLIDINRMEHLVSRMLTLARLEQDSGNPHACADLSEVLLNVVERIEPAASLRGINIRVVADSSLHVNVDRHDAELLCSNLLMNAIQHSPPESVVVASVWSRGNRILLQVEDPGGGIPEEALPHVFDRFFRSDTARSRSTGGAGLGLAICQAIVTRAGGTIQVNSASGQGTTVSVDLPLAAVSATAVERTEQHAL